MRNYFPEGWRESFGVTYGEFKRTVGVEVLDEYALMEVVVKKGEKPKEQNRISIINSPGTGENENGG